MDAEKIHEIIEENRKLKQRILELERRLEETRATATFKGDQTQVGKVLKLLEQRDQTLDEIATELHQKKIELEEAIARLEERNQQIQTWIATLGMYQQLIDDDPFAILGFSREGKLILYNRSAVTQFGDRVRQWRLHEVEDLDFTQFDLAAPQMVRDVLKSGQGASTTISRGSRTITTTGYVMGPPADPHGALLKIAVAG